MNRPFPVAMMLFGFVLYSYGYWRCKFGTDESWFWPVGFAVGIILFAIGLFTS